MAKREIFGIGPGGYEMCEVTLSAHMKEGFMLVRRDNGQELVCIPAYGTWMAITPYDMLYRLMWQKKELKRLREAA